MSDAAPPILNPDTPLAFLDPTSAYQTSVSLYVYGSGIRGSYTGPSYPMKRRSPFALLGIGLGYTG